jgi:HPt (histidine-containing phosphotransfer) domain-containing protein
MDSGLQSANCAKGASSGLTFARPDPQTQPVVDLTHLRRYTLGDHKLEREVLDLFLAQLPATISALRAAASDQDWKMAAHSLKGSGRAVGAWSLANVAEQAERLPGVADLQRCGEQIDLIEQAAADVRAFIANAYQRA